MTASKPRAAGGAVPPLAARHQSPEPYYSDGTVTIYGGDCRTVLADLPDVSIDAIVTDPPAGVHFMGRDWDADRGGRDQWIDWLGQRMAEAFRVLKPGGHALVWALPRTSHWTAMALEDAGFDIRDCILHLFGSGFPKSLDVSKAIDKTKRRDYVLAAINLGLEIPGNNLHDWTKAEHSPGDAWWEKFRAHLSPEDWGRLERTVTGQRTSGATAGMQNLGPSGIRGGRYDVTSAATEDAAVWSGWGTALKPGQEIWWLVRKPLAGTVAGNVLEHGTGALNIDGCRVAWDPQSLAKDTARRQQPRHDMTGGRLIGGESGTYEGDAASPAGRWPSNIVLTHSAACNDGPGAPDCPVAELDKQSGIGKTNTPGSRGASGKRGIYGDKGAQSKSQMAFYEDVGGASRFFPVFRYEAKAPASERPRGDDGTAHVTVKPLGLVRWLVRLVTPPGGVCLDPFLGSGTTAEACLIEGFRCIGIERDPAHLPLIKARLAKPIQPTLGFGAEEAS